MPEPWNEGVLGEEVPVLINSDAEIIRVEAGPGTGKTFGLVRRVERILHPEGLNARPSTVLVVAFNRVIAKDLRREIEERLVGHSQSGLPIILTVHALCLRVIGKDMRLLLPHEWDAMVYDVLEEHDSVRAQYRGHREAGQAIREHEAGHREHTTLWQACRRWLSRHGASLLGDLPGLLLDHIHGGDFGDQKYRYVVVDEFQDLTPGEQELFFHLRHDEGQLLALGDSRQSIYAFRGNDRLGLSRLDSWAADMGASLIDIPLRECQRCPAELVEAANQLMSLSGVERMQPVNDRTESVHLLVWNTPLREAKGMAKHIFDNLQDNPDDRHLVMVTRRQFGFRLRHELLGLDSDIQLDLSFEESLLENWGAREAFQFFCLLVDPDPPSWRSWLGYRNPSNRADYLAPARNAAAYLQLLQACNDQITESDIRSLSQEPRGQRRGAGGSHLWDRAHRYISLKEMLHPNMESPEEVLTEILDPASWGLSSDGGEDESALDLLSIRARALELLDEIEQSEVDSGQQLTEVCRVLRYQIATREPFIADTTADLQITTLWGAKGVTADHVYILGLCDQAIPGSKRNEYPGTETDFIEEQRRLFYVSITRSKKTLVLSRAKKIKSSEAARLGLPPDSGSGWTRLKMCRFLRDIRSYLPSALDGDSWSWSGS